MQKLHVTVNIDDETDKHEFADAIVKMIAPDEAVLSMGVRFGEADKPYRGALEICQDIVAAQIHETRLRDELRDKTGQEFDEFCNGMARLLAPVED